MSLVSVLCVLIPFIASVSAQNAIATDVTIGETQFRFTYLPTVESIKSVASEFCINNQEALGIAPLTEETLGNCHNPIAIHLQDVAAQYARDTTPLATDMTIGENQFRFTFFPTVDSIKSVASEFCINNQEVLGVAPLTEETLGTCHNPIATHLRDVAVQHARETTPISTDITIGDNQFRFTFMPTVDSIKTVASEFCINNQETLGIAPLTEDTLGDCHNPIATRLRDVATQVISGGTAPAEQPQSIATDITIGDNQFRFTFLPTLESIKSVASEFCINNQEALGIAPLTEETLADCHNPIATRLRDVAVEYVDSQQASGVPAAPTAEDVPTPSVQDSSEVVADKIVDEEDDGTVVIEL